MSKILKVLIANQPKKGWGLISKIADHLGVNQVVISQILAGTRDLRLDQTYQLAGFWNLTKIETDYLALMALMALMEKAASNDLKKYASDKMTKLREEMLKVYRAASNLLMAISAVQPDQQRRGIYSEYICQLRNLPASAATRSSGPVNEELILKNASSDENRTRSSSEFIFTRRKRRRMSFTPE